MKLLFSQAIQFFGLSGIGWLLDFSTFSMLEYFRENPALNNFISSFVGLTFVFIFASGKVFRNSTHIPIMWKYLIYLVYQLVLITLMSRFLAVINTWITVNATASFIVSLSPMISKITITPITMLLNFFVMKHLIEKL